jgi:hypothetical protein
MGHPATAPRAQTNPLLLPGTETLWPGLAPGGGRRLRLPSSPRSAASHRVIAGLSIGRHYGWGVAPRARRPAGNHPCALTRLHIVRDAGEQSAQLDGGRKLATTSNAARIAVASASVTTNICRAWGRWLWPASGDPHAGGCTALYRSIISATLSALW